MIRRCECGRRAICFRRIRFRRGWKLKVFADRRHWLCIRHNDELYQKFKQKLLMKNREIKFRGWHTLTGKMIDLKKITPLATNTGFDGLFLPFADEVVLMQFTGAKDILGVDVYEGDILDHSAGYGKVVYVPSVSSYEIWFGDGGNISLWEACSFGNTAPAVVGNIFENPEMVAEKENI